MKFIVMLLPLLTGCTVGSHSFVIKDAGYNDCYYIEDSTVWIDSKLHWENLNDQNVHSSDQFDIRVVQNGNYVAAASSMKVKIEDCRNGLMFK